MSIKRFSEKELAAVRRPAAAPIPKTQPSLTVADIEAGYDHADWLGWGYLNGRNHLEAIDMERADAIVLEYANAHGWSAERLFVWLNSRPGRHFADDPFHPGAARCLSVRLEGVAR